MANHDKRSKVTGEKPLTGRIMCIDDFPMYAHMVAMLLERDGGHTVQTEILPLSMKVLSEFDPDIIIVNLVRKPETISAGGMQDFYSDVDGAKAFRAISNAIKAGELDAPIILTSLAVLERELPKNDSLEYIAFVEVPQKMDILLTIIRKTLETRVRGGGAAPQ